MVVQNGPKPLLSKSLGFGCIQKIMTRRRKNKTKKKKVVTSFWWPFAMETIQDGHQTQLFKKLKTPKSLHAD